MCVSTVMYFAHALTFTCAPAAGVIVAGILIGLCSNGIYDIDQIKELVNKI